MPTKIEKDAVSGRETTGHEWDGIKELNNPLPKWWVYIFYATIVFAAIYSLIIFNDRIDAMGWAGMGLIVTSGIAATVLRQRAVPRAPAEEH